MVEEILTFAANLNGAMLKRAEIEGNLSEFYLRLFEKIYSNNFSSEEDFLFIFGYMGG